MEKDELLTDFERNSTSLELAVMEDSESCRPLQVKAQSSWHKAWKSVSVPSILFSIGLTLGLMIGIVGSTILTPATYRHWTTSYSPALPHISLKPEKNQGPATIQSDPSFLYRGPVSVDQEKAWAQLLTPVTMPLTKNELELAGENPGIKVELSDRKHYLASLGVFHELHCLRKIRRVLYRDFWYTNLTARELAWEYHHADHCLATIHRSLMCYANIGVYTFQWLEGVEKPATMTSSERMCVDWERFHEWAIERAGGFNPALYRPPSAM